MIQRNASAAKPVKKPVEVLPESKPQLTKQSFDCMQAVMFFLVLLLIASFCGWWVEAADRRMYQQQLERIQLSRVVHGG